MSDIGAKTGRWTERDQHALAHIKSDLVRALDFNLRWMHVPTKQGQNIWLR